MTIDIYSLDLVTIISFIVGLVGTILAIQQTMSMRKARSLYEEKCSTRCKDIVSIVTDLSGNMVRACERIQRDMKNISRNPQVPKETALSMTLTSATIASAMTATKQLIRFCERLNEEHKKEFGYKVYGDNELTDLARRVECFIEGVYGD